MQYYVMTETWWNKCKMLPVYLYPSCGNLGSCQLLQLYFYLKMQSWYVHVESSMTSYAISLWSDTEMTQKGTQLQRCDAANSSTAVFLTSYNTSLPYSPQQLLPLCDPLSWINWLSFFPVMGKAAVPNTQLLHVS